MTTQKSDAVKAGIMPDYSRAGVVLCRTGMYHAAAQDELISGDTLQMVPIPKGAQILEIHVIAKLLGGTLNFDGCSGCHVGDGSSSSRFFDDLSLTNIHGNTLLEEGKPGAIGYTYDEGDDTIDIAFKKAATVNPTDLVIIMNVFYKMSGSISDEDFQTENTVGG
jgi:hypothetical protein